MKDSLERRRARARRARTAQRYGTVVLVVVAAAVLLAGLPWLVWKGPYVLDPHIDTKKVGDGTGSAALVTGLRTALVACIAALGAGIALFYTARGYRLSHRGQVTERFTKALERLDSEKTYVRIGGILALEQIVQDSPEQATDAAQILGHFIRHEVPSRYGPDQPKPDGAPATTRTARVLRYFARPIPTPAPAVYSPKLSADTKRALTALTRRASRIHVDPGEHLDLAGLFLGFADFEHADLTGANLGGADLSGALLYRADLTDASCTGRTCAVQGA
ncbi:pentapeptide repeat-containing protein [Streptomyces sp. NPDC026589]|uniref:pentapeptide repeat-containing protein n=1 Tax=Streptomyces sp. NPDC026589 TaxID=3155609 RepID=UPI0033D08C0F